MIRLWELGIRTIFDLERAGLHDGCKNSLLLQAVGAILFEQQRGSSPTSVIFDEDAIVADIQIRIDNPHVHRLRQIFNRVGERLGDADRRLPPVSAWFGQRWGFKKTNGASRPLGLAGAPLEDFGTALHNVAPAIAQDWVSRLTAAFEKFGLESPNRMSAAIGQFLVEAGQDFGHLSENLNYSAVRAFDVFPHKFASVQDAANYVGDEKKFANYVYASDLGNGDESSGDGYRFRGGGLIQLTGRAAFTKFGQSIGKTAEDAADLCRLPEGAALSGCWYLKLNGCLPLADVWDIDAITRRVNGKAMLKAKDRRTFSYAMLSALIGHAES